MPPELLLLPWMLLVLSCSLYREPWQKLLSCLVRSLSSGTVAPSELHSECFNLCLRQTYPLHLQSGALSFLQVTCQERISTGSPSVLIRFGSLV